MPHAVIVGATGQIGLAAVRTLARHGWTVTTVDRGNTPPPADWEELGVRRLLADREDPAGLDAAVAGGADLLLDTVAYDDTHAEQLIRLGGDVGSFVVISSAAVYAGDKDTPPGRIPTFAGPVSESQRTVAPSREDYGTSKMLMERVLLDSALDSVTTVRAGAIYGPGCTSPRELWPLLRAIDRRPAIPLSESGESVFHPISTDNIAELSRLAAASPGKRALNAGDPQPPSVAEIVALVCATVDHAPDLVPFPGPAAKDGPTKGAGKTPWSIPGSFVLDMSLAATEIGYLPVTTYAEAVVEACEWLREVTADRPWQEALPKMVEYYGDTLVNYDAEDALLATL